MRRAVLILLVAAGCHPYDEHHIEAAWSIDSFAGGEIGCPDGWETVRLVAVDPRTPASRTVDTFPCDALAGTSSYLPADSYLAWLEVADGAKVLATSPPTTTEVTSFDPDLIADIYVDAGYATVAWPAGPDPVMIDLRGDLDLDITTYFEGSAAAGVLGPIQAGRYRATATVGAWSQALPDVIVTAPNGLTDLGTLPIASP